MDRPWAELLAEAAARRADPWQEDLDGGLDPAGDPVDPAAFEPDLERVFGRAWLAVCRESELPAPGAWRRVDVGRRRALVTRTERGLHAVANVCPHRGATLVDAPCGADEVLRCPYHGLGWGLDGALRSAPRALGFGPSLDGARLPSFPVATWGGFVFLSFAPDPPPLAAFLGDLADVVGPWPLAESVARHTETFEVPLSWRLAVEGFLEALHLPLLHPRTVAPFVAGHRGAQALLGDHSVMLGAWRTPNLYAPDGPVGRAAHLAGVDVFPGLDPIRRGHNFTALLFPNVTLNLLANHWSATWAWPVAPDRARITRSVFGLPPRNAAAAAWLDGVVANHRAILAEDFAMLARVQEGLRAGHLPGLVRSASDRRIRHFYRRLAAWRA